MNDVQEFGSKAEAADEAHASSILVPNERMREPQPIPLAVSDMSPTPMLREDDDGRIDDRQFVTQSLSVDPAVIGTIRVQWKRRTAWHRAEKVLTLQAKALCRGLAKGGDKKEAAVIYNAALGKAIHPEAQTALAAMLPIFQARAVIEPLRDAIERELCQLVKKLPVAPWIRGVRGVALLSLAAIVGEGGDLNNYPNPAKLWKRFGLAPYKGKACSTWRMKGGLTSAEWADQENGPKYRPRRRSVHFLIGGGLIGGMSKGKRPLVGEDISLRDDWSYFEKLFVERIRYEAARHPEFLLPPTKEGKESYTQYAARRAQIYVEKRFLLFLWREWHGRPQR